MALTPNHPTPHTPMKSHPLLILLVLPSLAAAAPPDGQLSDHSPRRAWLENYDPTLVSSRFVSEFSFESHDNDADYWKIENTLRWGIPLRDGLALGMQMVLPVKWTETATDDAFGLGDLELRTGLVGRISPTLRYGLGLNAVIDSATDALLSDNAFILRPIAAIRWDASDRLTLGCNVEYNVTPLDEGANDVSALELKFPLALKITEEWSAYLSYNPRWDLLAESDRQRLELGGTRIWGADNQYALSFGTEVPLDSESFEYKVLAGFHWYF
jgi:hypothetical protein